MFKAAQESMESGGQQVFLYKDALCVQYPLTSFGLEAGGSCEALRRLLSQAIWTGQQVLLYKDALCVQYPLTSFGLEAGGFL